MRANRMWECYNNYGSTGVFGLTIEKELITVAILI
jgi:hypothetical protein